VDLCCGAGGLSHGLEQAGFHTVFALDNDADACESYRAAFPEVIPHRQDIREVSFTSFRGIDLIAGGPPCQPFSIGGRRLGKGDCRDLLPEFVRAVAEARPRAFLLENVPGLASPAHRGYLTDMLAPLRDRFSLFGPYVVNAADYRVPQSRRRLVVIGLAEGVFFLPAKISNKGLTAGDVLTRDPVGEPNPSKIVYAKNPDLRPNPYHGHLFNGGGRAIDPKAPAPTILASAGGNKTHFIDGDGLVPAYHRHLLLGGKPRIGELPGARRLTVAECAVLQTFPAGAAFAGARSSQYEQVGNAVPPSLAAVLADAILTGLNRVQLSAHALAVA
jgi:DNA (cytosine-5)-methyltransferase 1